MPPISQKEKVKNLIEEMLNDNEELDSMKLSFVSNHTPDHLFGSPLSEIYDYLKISKSKQKHHFENFNQNFNNFSKLDQNLENLKITLKNTQIALNICQKYFISII